MANPRHERMRHDRRRRKQRTKHEMYSKRREHDARRTKERKEWTQILRYRFVKSELVYCSMTIPLCVQSADVSFSSDSDAWHSVVSNWRIASHLSKRIRFLFSHCHFGSLVGVVWFRRLCLRGSRWMLWCDFELNTLEYSFFSSFASTKRKAKRKKITAPAFFCRFL